MPLVATLTALSNATVMLVKAGDGLTCTDVDECAFRQIRDDLESACDVNAA